MLLDISPQQLQQFDLFAENQEKSTKVMAVMDHINHQFGKDSIFIAAEGIRRSWIMRSAKRSHRYTTRWDELLTVRCQR